MHTYTCAPTHTYCTYSHSHTHGKTKHLYLVLLQSQKFTSEAVHFRVTRPHKSLQGPFGGHDIVCIIPLKNLLISLALLYLCHRSIMELK